MKKIFAIFSLCIITAFASDATIEIIKRIDRIPSIAVQDASAGKVDDNLNTKFFKLLIGDLKVTTHFQVKDKRFVSSYEGNLLSNFLTEEKVDLILRYELSGSIQAGLIAKVKLLKASDGTIRHERNFSFPKGELYPFLAHKITSQLCRDLNLPTVDWMEKYLIFSKYTGKKISEIAIADYTLTYQKTIIKGGLNIFPKWADKNQESFYYTSYNEDKPAIYKASLYSANKEKIISGQGMLVVSDISEDGNKLLLTMSPKDQADIYLLDRTIGKLSQVTTYSGIDVSGNFVDDDSKVVFISDRLGYPNVFMKAIGKNIVEQMVYHGRNNSSASTFKNYIVYSSRESHNEFTGSTFNLYLISTKTDFIRQLTATGKNLFPRFSHDGESIVFIKDYGKQSALGIIRLGANKTFHFPLKVGKIQSLDW